METINKGNQKSRKRKSKIKSAKVDVLSKNSRKIQSEITKNIKAKEKQLRQEQRKLQQELQIQERLRIISMKLQNAKNLKTINENINSSKTVSTEIPSRSQCKKESKLIRNHEDLSDSYSDQSDFSDSEDVDRKYNPAGFTCQRCNSKFDTTDQLYYHARNNHTYRKFYRKLEEIQQFFDNEDRTFCPICEKPLRKHCKAFFVKHLKAHNMDRQFECLICFKKFRSKVHMKRHQDRHVIDLDDLADVYKRPVNDTVKDTIDKTNSM